MKATISRRRTIYRSNRNVKKNDKPWKKKFRDSPSALQLPPCRESPASWMMAMSRSPSIRQVTWWVWQRQWRTWWEAGSNQPAANVAARNTALMMKPTGYKVNLMSAACIIGLKVYQGNHFDFLLLVLSVNSFRLFNITRLEFDTEQHVAPIRIFFLIFEFI